MPSDATLVIVTSQTHRIVTQYDNGTVVNKLSYNVTVLESCPETSPLLGKFS